MNFRQFFLTDYSADNFPAVPLDHVIALSSTGPIWKGKLNEIMRKEVPLWMQYGAKTDGTQKAFIRDQSEAHFETTFNSRLDTTGVNDINNPRAAPRYVEIKFQNERLCARSFHSYRRSFMKARRFILNINNFPKKNQIYIMMQCGDIYSSKLEDWYAVNHPTN